MKPEERPLTIKQQAFIDAYIKTGNATQAYIDAGYKANTNQVAGVEGHKLLKNPKIEREIRQLREAARERSIASAQDVMEFFTKAMNGEIKDQFGLEATLGDRIRAGQELAKRTIDLENRLNGKADSKVEIVVNWQRKRVNHD